MMVDNAGRVRLELASGYRRVLVSGSPPWRRPQQAVAELRAADGVGTDARRVIVRGAGDQTRSKNGEQPPDRMPVAATTRPTDRNRLQFAYRSRLQATTAPPPGAPGQGSRCQSSSADHSTRRPGLCRFDHALSGSHCPRLRRANETKDLLNALPETLTHAIPTVTRRSSVDGTPSSTGVLCDMRRHVPGAQVGHAGLGVIAFVVAQRPWLEPSLARLIDGGRNRVSFCRAARPGQREVQQQAVSILHERVAGERQVGFLALPGLGMISGLL
jgi:hypothetical protein